MLASRPPARLSVGWRKKDKKENDTSAAQATETDCTAAELVTTEPEAEITISEMIDQRIKEEGKIMSKLEKLNKKHGLFEKYQHEFKYQYIISKRVFVKSKVIK